MAALGGSSEASGSVLLSWHEKVGLTRDVRNCGEADRQLTEVAGVGCIVRVMTDRRTL